MSLLDKPICVLDTVPRSRDRSHCRFCGAAVLWRVTERGKNIPIDGHDPIPLSRWRDARGVNYANFNRELVHFANCKRRPERPKRRAFRPWSATR